MTKIRLVIVQFLLLTLSSSVATAQIYRVVVQPDYRPEQAALVYEPLLEYLREATQLQFELVTPRTYYKYWNDMRQNNAGDVVIDDAHFTDYRIQRYGYKPLVKSNAPMRYSLLTSGTEDNLRAFYGRRVSTMPSPSLGYLVLMDWYPNPIRQPVVHAESRSWRDTVEFVFSYDADAAFAPEWLGEMYPNLGTVQTSKSFPGITVSVSPDVNSADAVAIQDALLDITDDSTGYEALVEMNVDRFVTATAAEYAGLEELLSATIGY